MFSKIGSLHLLDPPRVEFSIVIIMKVLELSHDCALGEKCPNTKYLSVFSPNARKYGPEKTPYLDTFHAVARRSKSFTRAQIQA